MIPTDFKESNIKFNPPLDLEESQCKTIFGYHGILHGGSCDGSNVVVTAWKPTVEELKKLNDGCPIYLCCIGGLPPHYLCTSFEEAISIQ